MTPLLAGVSTWFAGRPGDGIAALERAIALDPAHVMARWSLGYGYALVGRVDDAGRQAEWLRLNTPPGMPYTVQLLALVAALRGQRDAALALLAPVRTEALDGHTRFHFGEACAMAGDTARALRLFREGVEGNFYPPRFIGEYTPFTVPVRNTPEFAEILAIADRRVAGHA
jgi:hypothetical protein